MCGGGGSAAAEARAADARAKQEAADREARIKQGQAAIDTAFGQYNQPYYDKYSKSIVDYQQPELDRQSGLAGGKLAAALAAKGMLESTVGAQQFGDIGRVYADQSAQITNQAADSAKALQAKVEGQKSNLYALNQASADPASINAQAIGSSTAIAAPTATSPIGDVFSGTLAPYLAFQNAKLNSPGQPYRSQAPVATGAGSSRNVGGA